MSRKITLAVFGLITAFAVGIIADVYVLPIFRSVTPGNRKAIYSICHTNADKPSIQFAIYTAEHVNISGFVEDKCKSPFNKVYKFWRAASPSITNDDIDCVDVIEGDEKRYCLRIILSDSGGDKYQTFAAQPSNKHIAIYLNGKPWTLDTIEEPRHWFIILDGILNEKDGQTIAEGLIAHLDEDPAILFARIASKSSNERAP